MSLIGRDSRNSPDSAPLRNAETVGVAAGTFPDRLVGTPTTKPISDEDRVALRRLCDVGKMIRRSDGSYGTASKKLVTNAVAVRLKARGLAIPGFDKDMYPSIRGKQIIAEEGNAGNS